MLLSKCILALFYCIDIGCVCREADHYDENYSPINPPKFNYVRQARFETLVFVTMFCRLFMLVV